MRIAPAALAALTLFAAGCSSSRPDPTPVEPVEETPAYPPYETFDPAGYDAEPPPPDPNVEHDIPDELMDGRIDTAGMGELVEVDGYRLQLFSSESKASADAVRDEFAAWWASQREAGAELPDGLRGSVPIVVEFLPPYYRVRVGAFEYRAEAQASLGYVRNQFADAFIIPSRVTIER
jgi:hypothetical protein